MDNISTEYFLNLFDEFKGTAPAKLKAYITIASGRVPESVWKTNTQYATALLTAHLLSQSGPQGAGGAGGALTAEQVGDLSRSFAPMFQVGAGDALYMSSGYGVQFVALRRETIVPAMVGRGIRRPGSC